MAKASRSVSGRRGGGVLRRGGGGAKVGDEVLVDGAWRAKVLSVDGGYATVQERGTKRRDDFPLSRLTTVEAEPRRVPSASGRGGQRVASSKPPVRPEVASPRGAGLQPAVDVAQYKVAREEEWALQRAIDGGEHDATLSTIADEAALRVRHYGKLQTAAYHADDVTGKMAWGGLRGFAETTEDRAMRRQRQLAEEAEWEERRTRARA